MAKIVGASTEKRVTGSSGALVRGSTTVVQTIGPTSAPVERNGAGDPLGVGSSGGPPTGGPGDRPTAIDGPGDAAGVRAMAAEGEATALAAPLSAGSLPPSCPQPARPTRRQPTTSPSLARKPARRRIDGTPPHPPRRLTRCAVTIGIGGVDPRSPASVTGRPSSPDCSPSGGRYPVPARRRSSSRVLKATDRVLLTTTPECGRPPSSAPGQATLDGSSTFGHHVRTLPDAAGTPSPPRRGSDARSAAEGRGAGV